MTKKEFLNLVERLPEDTAFAELATQIETFRFKNRVQRGLDQLSRGECVPHEEVEAMMDSWMALE